jgi:hypothetical protein
MAMVCPQCNRAFAQQLNCPDCGGRLLYQANTRGPGAVDDASGEVAQWQQTPWGRMAIGLILAQGLGYGLQQALTAGLLASGSRSSVWTTLWGIVFLHCLQGACLLVGGALCGAGKQRGVLYGSVIGLVNGLIFLMVQRQTGEILTEVALYGQPLLHLAFGAFGGLIGTLIWKPPPSLPVPDGPADKRPVALPAPNWTFLSGPVYMGRVTLGVCIVVAGVVWSNAILAWVLNASQGTLGIKTHLQTQLIGWEVCALATLFGAGLAGSNTFNGFKQGLCVGVGASLILAGVHLSNQKVTFETTIFTILGILIFTAAGGWFGSQLLPPLGPVKRRNRILTG